MPIKGFCAIKLCTTKQLLRALVVNKVPIILPHFQLVIHLWLHTTNVQLAYPEFYMPKTIGILIKADIFAKLLLESPVCVQTDKPFVTPTSLDYVLSVPVLNSSKLVENAV